MAEILPPELMLHVFNYLDDRQLVHASHVCRSWRLSARDHPTFWSHITVRLGLNKGLPHPHRDYILARLAHRPDCPLRFQYDGAYASPDIVGPFLLPLLAAHTHRLVALHLNLDRDMGTVETLCRFAAPMLEILSLRFEHLSDLPTVIPPGIFTGCAPHLVDAAFNRASFVEGQPYAAFSNVTTVSVGLRSRQRVFPAQAVCSAFPAMSNLCIYGHEFTVENGPPPALLRRLKRLEVESPDAPTIVAFLDWLNSSSLPEIWTSCPYETVISDMPEHLVPPLHIRYGGKSMARAQTSCPTWRNRGAFAVHSLVDGKVRVFDPESYHALPTHPIKTFCDAFKGFRDVQELTLDADDLNGMEVLEHRLEFPAVRILRMRLIPIYEDPEEEASEDTVGASISFAPLSLLKCVQR